MDAMVATASFLAPRPQNATKASPSLKAVLSGVISGLAPGPCAATASPYDSGYDWQRSTEENYRCDSQSDEFFGEFQEFRRRLDLSYHHNYIPSRQGLHDSIIRSLLWSVNRERGSPSKQENSRKDTRPWIVFTAGVYGAGKSHTIGKLQALGCFPPKSSFVGVDQDEIRRMLPEFSLYRKDQAGAFTQKEAGMIAELITDIALSSGKNVVVDGSLRDAAWHEGYFQSLRARFGNDSEAKTKKIRIGILYVTAPIDEIYLRVEQRGILTGRSIPAEFLERSMKEVPEAIERLRPKADLFLHVHNSQSDDEVSIADSEQGSFASLVEDASDEDEQLFESKRQEDQVGKSDIEATIFHEECRSMVGVTINS
eukprot:CAMPEP_0197268382 /NCGR_PEP_ID=MMETSP1432-20130617/4143_1 /TAXON_ID=44447 /ORGANISM="Pseudo-nitzschia delicatissima, Strain UNC1205" /LENGTH=368 /DNA_ID=CAMNT_0042733427 /DNA_START=266 /DNA_END=1372 /DNA_ORIENTATION=+